MNQLFKTFLTILMVPLFVACGDSNNTLNTEEPIKDNNNTVITDDTNNSKVPYLYGKKGTHKVQVSIYSEDNLSVIYHPTSWDTTATPVIFFATGWHDTNHNKYKTLLTFIASHGYSVVYVPDSGSYYSQLQKFDAIIAEFANTLDTKKIGVVGHSSGGGFSFKVLDYMSQKGYGTDGRFLMAFDPYFAYSMSSKSMGELPSNTNLVILQFGKDGGWKTGNNTDPRIPLSEYSLLTSIAKAQKDYQVYEKENANHGYISGDKSPTLMQGALKPLDALMEFTFKNKKEAHDTALEVGSDTPLKDGLQQLRSIDDYKYACNNEYANFEIDYCHVYERKEHKKTYPEDTAFNSVKTKQIEQPNLLATYIDPVFHNKVTRITNMKKQKPGSFHPYPKQGSVWNSDMSVIRLGYRLYNAKTFDELAVTSNLDASKAYAKVGSPAQGAADLRWSKLVPNRIFVLDSSQKFKTVSINKNKTDTMTHKLIDLSGLGYEKVTTGANEGNIDYHDNYIVFAAKKPADDTVYVLLYKIGETKIRWQKPLHIDRGTWANGFDWISVDAKGKHILASTQGKMYLYDMKLEHERLLAQRAEHGDLGIATNGDSVYVEFHSGGRGIWLYNLDHVNEPLKMLESNYGGGHISCRNYMRQGWCYVNTAQEGYKEVFALKLDNATGTVERFAQTHGGEKNTGCTQVSVSPDGSEVLFASSWNLGSEEDYQYDKDNHKSCTDHTRRIKIDTYHVKVGE